MIKRNLGGFGNFSTIFPFDIPSFFEPPVSWILDILFSVSFGSFYFLLTPTHTEFCLISSDNSLCSIILCPAMSHLLTPSMEAFLKFRPLQFSSGFLNSFYICLLFLDNLSATSHIFIHNYSTEQAFILWHFHPQNPFVDPVCCLMFVLMLTPEGWPPCSPGNPVSSCLLVRNLCE